MLLYAHTLENLCILLWCEADLSDTSFHLFLVVCLSQLQDLRLEELLFEDFVKGGQKLEHLGGGELVREHPQANPVGEDAGHVVSVFPAEEAEVESEEGIVCFLGEEGKEATGFLIRPVQ